MNLALLGTPVPVSGLAKALGGGSLRTDLVAQYLSFGVVGPVHGMLGAQAVVVVVVALVLLRRAAVRGRALLGWADRPVATVLAALLLAQVAQLGYYTVTSSWPLWPWYFYYIPVMLLLGLLVVVRVLLSTPVAVVAGRSWPAVAVALAACALTVGASWGKPPAAFWDGGVPAAAQWITTHTRPTDVVAVGDRAGYLSWLTHRPTVQLEGLVEDAGYLDVVQHRRIAQHLAAQGVRWYVRGDDLPGGPTAPVPHRPGCTGQLEPAMGGGPKSVVVACDQDLVYNAVEQAYRWRIWRYGG
jgi:hypothetical protein